MFDDAPVDLPGRVVRDDLLLVLAAVAAHPKYNCQREANE